MTDTMYIKFTRKFSIEGKHNIFASAFLSHHALANPRLVNQYNGLYAGESLTRETGF